MESCDFGASMYDQQIEEWQVVDQLSEIDSNGNGSLPSKQA